MTSTARVPGRPTGAALLTISAPLILLGLILGQWASVAIGVVLGAAGIGLVIAPAGATARVRAKKVALTSGIAAPVELVLTILAFSSGGANFFGGVIALLAGVMCVALSIGCATLVKG